jgi:hypothetical protein
MYPQKIYNLIKIDDGKLGRSEKERINKFN